MAASTPRLRGNTEIKRKDKMELPMNNRNVETNKKLSRSKAPRRRQGGIFRCVALVIVIIMIVWLLVCYSFLQNHHYHRQHHLHSQLLKPYIASPRILALSGSNKNIRVMDGANISLPLPRREGDDDAIYRYLQPHARKGRKDSWYEKHARKELQDEETECPFIADWQKDVPNPTCNTLHELGATVTTNEKVPNRLVYLAEGSFKQVWQPILENNQPAPFVLKTSQIEDYTEDDLSGDQQDALIMERNTASNYVVTMYSYCHFSNLVERASNTLQEWVGENHQTAKPIDLLRVAYMMAQGVSDMHMYTKSKSGHLLPTLAHADIKATQFLQTSPGYFKLNDFNRGKFLTSKDGETVCPFYMPGVHHKGSTMRAPEEYEDSGAQDDKIDVFSLGSSLYHLLTAAPPFYGQAFTDAILKIRTGIEPEIPDVKHDPSLTTIVKAIQMCRKKNSKDRPWSREVAEFLQKSLQEQEAAITTK